MPRGSKAKDTSKQKRRATHIEESYDKKGVGTKEAARRAYATVNKEEGGGKKPGGGSRAKKPTSSASKKGGRKGGRVTARKRTSRR